MRHLSRIKTGIAIILAFSVLFFTLSMVSFPLSNDPDFTLSFQIINFILLAAVIAVFIYEYCKSITKSNDKLTPLVCFAFIVFAMLYDIDIDKGEIVIFSDVKNTSGFYLGSLIKVFISTACITIFLKIKMKELFSPWNILAILFSTTVVSMVNFALVSELYLDLMMVVFTAVIYDVFGYFGGSHYGKRKAFPNTSPSKTIGGTTIGITTSVSIIFIIYGVIYLTNGTSIPALLNGSESIYTTIMLITLFSVCAMLGDLLFSKIKRVYQIKDFSNLLGSHGGIVDRVDGILTSLFAFLILTPLITSSIV